MKNPLPLMEKIIDLAIEEDLGRGDVTSSLTVDPELDGEGRAFSRQELTVSGLEVFQAVMHRVDPRVVVEAAVADGDTVGPDALLTTVRGKVASLLAAERVALNFLQRLSGVASLTRCFVDLVPSGARVRITDTRKTTPGMRTLERQAVLHGGGFNHRVDLGGGVLIKENHVAAAGSVGEAVSRSLAGAPHPLKVEVEVRNAEELEEALAAGAEAVLLDNMGPEEIRSCVELAQGKAFVEASGGVGLDNVAAIAATGVDAISIGALTHSAPSVDISFLLEGA